MKSIPFKLLPSESVFSKMYLKCQHGNTLLSIMDHLTAFCNVYYAIIVLLMTYNQVIKFEAFFLKKKKDCFILLCLKIIYFFPYLDFFLFVFCLF